ncbi:regulatory protein RecX [Pedobacter sp. BAL39]|uniref:regulatory protein RecX n=1 Tax=Pedobacter sp. BAL39 TaxID=391596 RepID=UPI000155952A|nr:regulatory protein RecX [Pedobacter sp. BAL39]
MYYCNRITHIITYHPYNYIILETSDQSEKKQVKLDRKTALAKAEHYCAYQERSQQEIRDKLYEWGLWSNEVEELISELISTNFLNEERFAAAYVSGKFNIKKWGKVKIKQGLKLKKVPEKMITKALNTIDYDAYLRVILEAAEKKDRLLKENDPYKRRNKLITYLMGKGFENNLIAEVLKSNNLY